MKIFCIGFHKTGTSSLAVALRSLGYRVTGPNGQKDPDIADNVLTMACDLAEQYDAFQDNPWPVIFREMDQRYPNSKFVLTLRDPESWIVSQVKAFGQRETPMRQWIYGKGCPKGNEDLYIRRFKEHNMEVLAYFKHRPDDLLVMDLTKGDGWDKFCPFLGAEIPDIEFPHANKSKKQGIYKLPKGVHKLLKRVNRLTRRIAAAPWTNY